MRAWCPRCDAVRPGETTCPACGTPLATLEAPSGPVERPDLPPPGDAPALPGPPSRLRVALAAATVVVAGLAFLAGRGAARPAPPAATAAPATSTTSPEPEADSRRLGWSDRVGGITVTALSASRLRLDRRETVAEIRFRFAGLPAGRRVLAVRGLRLLDSGGGIFSSVEQRPLGQESGTPLQPDDGDPGVYTVLTGPAPRLGALGRIELAGLVVDRPRDQAVELDTAGPWPAGPPLRAVDPGTRDMVGVDLGFTVTFQQPELGLRVVSAFVGGGRAVVVVDASSGFAFQELPPEWELPFSAELRAGGRVLCERTMVLGGGSLEGSAPGMVLACPTRPVPRLTLAVGAGVQLVDLDATLRP
jgi:hypothetical protein